LDIGAKIILKARCQPARWCHHACRH
jgi:hypothetical protein